MTMFKLLEVHFTLKYAFFHFSIFICMVMKAVFPDVYRSATSASWLGIGGGEAYIGAVPGTTISSFKSTRAAMKLPFDFNIGFRR
jgi:hypothetical protein